MQAQAYEGYFESGKFYTAGKPLRIPERRKVYITIFNEQAQNIPMTIAPNWLSELHQLLEESGDERLHMEDFPRMDFAREPLVFSDEG
ncbi:MAG: hypothetical protein FWE90_14310 [Defluviitaleaceae bacterium]|nr:hypothetical protein [Defluviitaleaceae bacterium]